MEFIYVQLAFGEDWPLLLVLLLLELLFATGSSIHFDGTQQQQRFVLAIRLQVALARSNRRIH